MYMLKAYRKKRGWTQAELAALLSVERLTVAHWEQGRRKIGIELLPRIHRVTGLHPADLRPDIAAIFQRRKLR
jgi:transcriptional regulator with XRE-family HTH domain